MVRLYRLPKRSSLLAKLAVFLGLMGVALRNRIEYWTAGVEAYFDAAADGTPPVGAERPITTREALKGYDPNLFALIEETMAYKEHVDWRIQPK